MAHNQSPSQEHKRTQFQIDRIAFFSDAVIAIAITLMVLEIKIPPVGIHSSVNEIISKYGNSFLIHLAALFICFMSIGNLWIRHHELYEHIINYNTRLIKVNLYFLLTIMLLPISISFAFTDDNPIQLKMILFFGNLCLCNFSYYIMLHVIFHPKNNFSAISMDEKLAKNKMESLGITITFALVCIFIALQVKWFYAPFIFWWVIRRSIALVKWRRKRRAAVLAKA